MIIFLIISTQYNDGTVMKITSDDLIAKYKSSVIFGKFVLSLSMQLKN